MKRIYIAVALTLAIIGVSLHSVWRIYQLHRENAPVLEAALEAAEQGQLEQAALLAEEFRQRWQEKQQMLLRFVRHDPLDRITSLAARLPLLAEYGDVSQFVAQTSELQALLDNLLEDELPLLRNLL